MTMLDACICFWEATQVEKKASRAYDRAIRNASMTDEINNRFVTAYDNWVAAKRNLLRMALIEGAPEEEEEP